MGNRNPEWLLDPDPDGWNDSYELSSGHPEWENHHETVISGDHRRWLAMAVCT
ncbi:MAG: hypothetical protein IPN08_02740 [Bacteroidales bacterium]|nr:hypothetical protein [Bacteroidales bacterium]